jgi:hypothetical protein
MNTRASPRRHDAHTGARHEVQGFDYVNHFEVGFGRYEVVLRFAQAFDGLGLQPRRTGVVMTPIYAKALMLMLSGAVSRFEAQHGELPSPAQAADGPASNDEALPG